MVLCKEVNRYIECTWKTQRVGILLVHHCSMCHVFATWKVIPTQALKVRPLYRRQFIGTESVNYLKTIEVRFCDFYKPSPSAIFNRN